jgi:hypothetical protein
MGIVYNDKFRFEIHEERNSGIVYRLIHFERWDDTQVKTLIHGE